MVQNRLLWRGTPCPTQSQHIGSQASVESTLSHNHLRHCHYHCNTVMRIMVVHSTSIFTSRLLAGEPSMDLVNYLAVSTIVSLLGIWGIFLHRKTMSIVFMWINGRGRVQVAHAQLVSSSGRLREQGQACPNQLMRTLMLLHSYILVKTLVRMGDHVVSTPSGHACTCHTRLHWHVSACPCPFIGCQVVCPF